MGSGFLNVGVTGLNAAQVGLRTSAHNIANASTPGFSRQYSVQTTNTPLFTGAGFVGQGTNVQTVQRVYNEFLQKQVLSAETNVAELQTYASQIAQIDNLLADPSAGLSPALQGFFSAVEEAAANPASIPARQAMISAGDALAARFQALDEQLSQMRSGINSQLATEVTTINSLVQQVANLNDRILVAQAASANQPANDLYDQRDKLVADLNKEIKVSVQSETDGSYSIFFGTGQPLVVGGQPYQLSAVPSAEDLTHDEVGLITPGGEQMRIPESLVTGGNLGGLLKFRSETLDMAQNQLGRVAMAVVAEVNAQHRLGQDIDGQAGGDLFTPISPTILGAPANGGSAIFAAHVTVSDYRVVYDGTNYNVTRLSDDTTFTPTPRLPMVVDGIQLSLSAGTPAAGDIFLVKPGALPSERVTKVDTGSSSDAVLSSTGSNIQTLTDSDYRLTITNVTTFTLTRLSDNMTWIGQGTSQAEALEDVMEKAAPQGFWLDIESGTALIGDSFLIRPTRNGARDIAMAVADPRDIAAAMGFRTAAAPTNAGTGTISAGSVEKIDAALSSPVKLTYEASSDSLIGFPVGSVVTVGTTNYKIASESQRVPFTAAVNYSFGGQAFKITGVPANGDVFIVDASGAPVAGNNGLAALFGVPVSAGNAATGSVTPATATMPIAIIAGVNDKFNIDVDGAGVVAVTLTPGSYTPTALRDHIDAQIDAAVAPLAVTVSLDASNQLVVTSDNALGSVTLTQNSPNAGTGAISAGTVGTSSGLPSATITLTYHEADVAAGLPARLTGFPVGSTVSVTLADGTVTEYAMNSADGFSDAAAFADHVEFTTDATIRFNGMRFEISGNPADGDTFTIAGNPSGTGDNRNMLAIGGLQLVNTMANGTATFQSAYSAMVSVVGNKAREIEVTQAAQENLAKQNRDAVESMSGVNLDEEAANLMRYQQAYQAAAKMIDISGKLFDILVDMGR